jgi:hypothetical protein
MLLGLGLPEWLTIIGLVGGLWLTFKMMARASVAYERARKRREQEAEGSVGRSATGGEPPSGDPGPRSRGTGTEN